MPAPVNNAVPLLEKPIIGFPRLTEDAAFSASIGSWDSDYPVSNLGLEPVAQVARSTGLGSFKVKATFDGLRLIRMVTMIGTNFTELAEYELWLFQNTTFDDDTAQADIDAVYASGSQYAQAVAYSSGSLLWGAPGLWAGRYTKNQQSGLNVSRALWLDKPYLASGLLLIITDPTNTDGYIQMGMLDIATGTQLYYGFEFGSRYGFRPRSELLEARGGTKYGELLRKPRTFKGTVKFYPRNKALVTAFESQRQNDLVTPMVWYPHHDEPTQWVRTTALMRNASLGQFGYAAVGHDEVPLDLEEVL